VSTAHSLTDAPTGVREPRRSVEDAWALLLFRRASLRGRSRHLAAYGLGAMVVLSVLAAWLPAYLPDSQRRTDTLSLLPTAMVGILVITLISAAAAGGGRELVTREQAVAFPITPTTDHLGALVMAPLNIAWLLQAWVLMGAVAYVDGPGFGLVGSQVVVVAWLLTATALGQVVGWTMEWIRRGRHGVWLARLVVTAFGLAGAYLVASGRLVPMLQHSPTMWVTIVVLRAPHSLGWAYVGTVTLLLLVTAGAVAAGAGLAGAVSLRPAREELRLESSTHPARPPARSDLAALMRIDRTGIWRSVPLRRGLVVLIVMPGLVAIAGGLHWQMLTILPGLVVSGGALLFGVNSWCLDGRGALWRDSQPVDPQLAFVSRALVLVEVLGVATLATVALASVRAGIPTGQELVAVACCGTVVIAQVVSASLRWSVRRPFSVDLRSARATPAPPLVMVSYSARLALSTTFVGMVFSGLARAPWGWSVLLALPMVLFSLWRLSRVAGEWAQPTVRSLVVATVAS